MENKNSYTIFDLPAPISKLNKWTALTSKFDQLIGYTSLGDFILRNSKSRQFAILFTIDPELVPLDVDELNVFEEKFLNYPDPQKDILQIGKINEIEKKIGMLDKNQIYIPEPYPFLGGDCSIESYAKGDVWVYAEIVGSMQQVWID